MSFLPPLLFLGAFAYAAVKKVKLFDSFSEGIKEAVPLLLSVFPCLAAMLMLSELFERSGLSALLTEFLSPAFRFLGIPPEISKLVLLKPFSGSGSTALLSELITKYGADSYIARCACVAYGSSETVFYISAVYFSKTEKRSLFKPVSIALLSNFLSVVFGCFLLRFL